MNLIGVFLYFGILVLIGIAASRRMKDVRDYFAAGKRLGYWVAAFSARATGESAWLLLGLTGMGAAVGVQAFWVVLGEVLGVGGAWIFMCRRFKHLTDRYDSITVPDYLESRFRDDSHRLRLVSAGCLVVFVTIYVSAQIDATGTAFESFLGWNYYLGALLGFAVVLVYIVAGGFLAVAWSDVFQGTMMVVGLVALPLVALAAIGPGEVAARLGDIDPALLSWSGAGSWTPIAVANTLGLALIGLGFLGSPQVFVRFIAMRSVDDIPKGAVVAIVWTLLADTGAVCIGLIGRAILTGPGDDLGAVLGPSGQEVLPLLVEHSLPALLVGVYIAIVLAAIMSTVDSLLVVAGSAAVRDYYQKVRRPDLPDASLVPASRRTTLLLASAALAIALTVAVTTPNRTIFWFVIFGWSGIAATFCPIMILSLFWSGLTVRGALAGMVTGFLGVPVFKFLAPLLPGVGPIFVGLAELGPAFLVSGLAAVAASLGDQRGRQALAGVGDEIVYSPVVADEGPSSRSHLAV
ncbi:MAG: sodium/proline symporter [Thermoanaerobaculia bacterium]|nr:sodium/proline symporter [Thermoanaerobaculia bacterium]